MKTNQEATNKKKALNVAAERPGAVAPAEEAFAKLRPRYEALDPKELVTINLDIPRAVSLVMGAEPRIVELISEMEALLKAPPVEQVRELKILALGAWYAHLLDTPVTTEGAKSKLLERGSELRARLLKAAEALADAGLVDPKVVESIKAGSGNIDKANDLVALSALYTQNWPNIIGKTAITAEQVEEAARVGPELLVALTERPIERSGAAADARARAFTLLAQAYDQVRRAVAYTRWAEDDADLIAPSLYTKAKKKRRPEEENAPVVTPEPEPTPFQPPTPPSN